MGNFFNSSQLPDRHGTNSVKWDTVQNKFGYPDLLPLWVADMDYPAPECIIEAVKAAASSGIFGYFSPPDTYQEAFIEWETTHHQVTPKREWLRFTPGVMAGIYWSINSLTEVNDSILIFTPCYYPFMDAVRDTKRKLICSNLIIRNGHYTFDQLDFENKIRNHAVRMILLCSPHNPLCHVWSKEDLFKIVDICQKYDVLIVSDEIHQDIVFNGYKNYSLLRFENNLDRIIVLTSASKTFNIAALQNSFAIIPNEEMRCSFDAFVKSIRIKKGVSLGYIAAEAGFRHGAPWLKEVLPYISNNYNILKSTLQNALPKIKIAPHEGTYMIWVDLSAYVKRENLEQTILEKANLAVDFGSWFWPEEMVPANDAHIRINIATSAENVYLAACRLIEALK